jgi:hypothetical protein
MLTLHVTLHFGEWIVRTTATIDVNAWELYSNVSCLRHVFNRSHCTNPDLLQLRLVITLGIDVPQCRSKRRTAIIQSQSMVRMLYV